MIKLPESLQEIFDVVSVKALEQGEKCMDETNTFCQYHNGNKCCFIGFVIPDEQYDPVIEGNDISSLILDEKVESDMPDALDALQVIHDSKNIDPKDWELHLRDYAKIFKLSTDKMDAYLSAKGVSKLD